MVDSFAQREAFLNLSGSGQPMNAAGPGKSLAKALEVIAEFSPADPTVAPVDFVRELARRWKENGGLLAGKHRHSDRYLDDLLRLQGTPIRSLTPKLVGRTNLKADDADVLVRLFLSHWSYKGDPHSGRITVPSSNLYEPMLSDAEIDEVSAYVSERIAAGETEASTPAAPPLLGQDTIQLIAEEFEESAALFNAAIGSPFLVPSEERALLGFKEIMDKLWAIERADSRGRILVWTMDLGRQVFADPESRLRFLHVQSLITRFKALVQFKDNDAEERWDWLQSHAIVVLHDTRSGRPDVPRLPDFDPNHVLFSAIPPKWAESDQFIALYGAKPAQANYSIFLRPAEPFPEQMKQPPQSPISSQSYGLRYFGHALVKHAENSEPKARGLQLPAPGWSYVEALGTVFVAAKQVLGLQTVPGQLSIDGTEINPSHAIEKLRHHGFRLLRLDDFVKF
jgi:hypothetical protein